MSFASIVVSVRVYSSRFSDVLHIEVYAAHPFLYADPSFGEIMSPPPETTMRHVNDTYNESGIFRNSRDGYLHALSTVRNASLNHGRPMWNYFKASGVYESVAKDAHGVNPAPTEAVRVIRPRKTP